MRKTWPFTAAEALIRGLILASTLAAAGADAATILEKDIEVTILGDDRVVERTRLVVRLDEERDLEEWRRYSIYLDDHRELIAVAAFSEQPGGKRQQVKRGDRDTVESSGSFVLADSAYYEVLSFESLTVGGRIVIEHEVEVAPYFPAGAVQLSGDDPIARLKVRISGGGENWRFRLDGSGAEFAVVELTGGVEVTGAELAAIDAPELAPQSAGRGPVLRYGWGRPGTWETVAAWYREILSVVPRASEPVRREARRLVAGLEDPRARLEALLAFSRKKVRYVAVAMGIGGYRPSTPEEVLERRWGDCKDKSLLLIDLLAEAGIPAHPVLILLDEEGRIDTEFPAPDQFNHLIVAIPRGAVEVSRSDPVSGGYLFLDPTQTRGSGGWLHPGVQDQDVLVVEEGGSRLVRTPILHHEEGRELIVNLQILPSGAGVGGVGLLLRGSLATFFLEQIGSTAEERTEETARAIFARLLPGVDLGDVGWSTADADAEKGGVPEVQLSSSFRVEGLVRNVERPSFRLTGLTALAGLPELEERDTPLVLAPTTARSMWHVRLPEGWCLAPESEQVVDNDLGSFVQTVLHSATSHRFTVERRSILERRWIEPGDFAAVRELSLAESRAQRRRVRLECKESG